MIGVEKASSDFIFFGIDCWLIKSSLSSLISHTQIAKRQGKVDRQSFLAFSSFGLPQKWIISKQKRYSCDSATQSTARGTLMDS